MTSHPMGPAIGRLTGIVIGIVLILWCTLLALPASAHDGLTDSDPAPGEVLADAPSLVTLTFSGEISDLGAQFVVTGPEGRDVVQGTPTVEGATVTQGLVEELVDGDYEAVWRVTSSDGHPISGTIDFTIEADPPAGGTPAPDDGDRATTGSPASDSAASDDATSDGAAANPANPSGGVTTDGATTDPAASTVGTAPTATPEGLATGEVTGREGIPAWGWLVAALAGLGLVACGFLAFRRN